MGMPFLLGTDYLRKIQSVRPQNLVSLWPQNEPLGHGVSTEIVRGYDGAYTATTLGGVGVPGTGMTSASYNGVTSFNNIYTAGLANDNLLLNPGFETPGAMPPTWANWADTIGDGAIANEVVIVHEGVDAAKITAGPTFNTTTGQTLALVAGQRYRLRFWTRGDGVNDGRYYIWSAGSGYIIPVTLTGVTAAAWGMVAAEFTAPATENAALYFRCPPVNGGICYFDACEVRRMNGFLGDQGTVIVPSQVANVGVWTDGFYHTIFNITSGTDVISLLKRNTNNTLTWQFTSGGVAELFTIAGFTTTDWFFMGMTWDKADDVHAGYFDGVPVAGSPQAIAGTWIGDVTNTKAIIGAANTTPGTVWSGNEGPTAVWSAALSPDEMRYLG